MEAIAIATAVSPQTHRPAMKAPKLCFVDGYRAGILLMFVAIAAGCSSKPAVPSDGSDQTSELENLSGLIVRFAGADVATANRVVILLHGYGANGDDLMGLADELNSDNNTAFVFPQAPEKLDTGGFAWTRGSREQLEESCGRILSIVKHVQLRNKSCSVTVGGFSQGATVAGNLLSNAHDGIASLILFSPANTILLPIPFSETAPHVFLSHGKDDTVLPFSGSEELREKMNAKGIAVDWHPFDGGHDLPLSVVAAAKQFLFPMAK